ncbi:MAG: MCE family protein [Alphaproteobacteria bacterium]|nr:MCE family protein [Alphaproteobacteria bacterium]
MKINKEIVVGALLTLMLTILLSAVHGKSVRQEAGRRFTLNATFSKADGLLPNSEVRLAGIRVGQIGKQKLADNGYQVVVQLVFDKPLDIPADSSVSIETDGIMGAKHIEILPGGEEELLKSGEHFSYTQDALILNELLDKVNLYMKDKKDKEKALKNAAKSEAEPKPETEVAEPEPETVKEQETITEPEAQEVL